MSTTFLSHHDSVSEDNRELPVATGAKGHNGQNLVDLSVLMPCYNEGLNLARNVERALRDLDLLVQQTYELILIDDGSTDGTYAQTRRIASMDSHVKVLRADSNAGKGAALQSAFEVSTGTLICFLDGDLQISARHIPRFIEYMRLEQADVVIASKRHPLSFVDYPRTRHILSRCYQLLITTLFGLPLTDTQAGLKLFRREVLERIFPRALVKRYAFDVEVLVNAHRLGYRIFEAPIDISGGPVFKSHVDLAAVRRMLHDTMGIFFRMYIRHYYDQPRSQVSPVHQVAVLGQESETLALAQYLAGRGVKARLFPFMEADSGDVALQRFVEEAFDLTFVCLGAPENVVRGGEDERIRPYLNLLARMIAVSGGYRCVAFLGQLQPGSTVRTIMPYLERAAQKRIERDFDVVVLPSVEELRQIEPQSRHPDPLLVGFTGLRGFSAISRILRELEPVMTRTDPTTAEVAYHVQRLVRANAQPLAREILDMCNATGADPNLVFRSSNIRNAGPTLNLLSKETA